MSFAAPWFLAAGAVAALALTALHFFARQRPQRAVPFPTARFVPERPARAPARSSRPSDLLLLALRLAALLLIAAAFARPTLTAARAPRLRVLLVDRSRAVASGSAARDSALAYFRDGDLLVVFDSAARLIDAAPRDTLRTLALTAARGSLSAAFVAARRAGALAALRADSVELVLISPLSLEEWDAATAAVRAEWPGGARVVGVGLVPPDLERRAVEVRGAGGEDGLTAGLGARRSALGNRNSNSVRVVRGSATAADSVWAAEAGRVLVRWPAARASGEADSAGALVMGDDVVVGPFARLKLPSAERRVPRPAVTARWGDGVPAVTETRFGATSCIRDVGILLPERGDLVLRESFGRVVEGLVAPCGGGRDGRGIGDSLLRVLAGSASIATARALARDGMGGKWTAFWMLLGALLLMMAEYPLRWVRPARWSDGAGLTS